MTDSPQQPMYYVKYGKTKPVDQRIEAPPLSFDPEQRDPINAYYEASLKNQDTVVFTWIGGDAGIRGGTMCINMNDIICVYSTDPDGIELEGENNES